MKIVAIGDPHFQVDNVPEVNIFIERIEKLILEESPDIIVVLGDLLHTHERLHTVPLNLAVNFILMLSKISKTFVLVGNHDSVNNQIFLNESHWMNCLKSMPNTVIVDKVIIEEVGEYKFVFCPYVPPGRFEEALNTVEGWKDALCIFAHQEFYGCKMGAIVSVEGDKWDYSNPMVVSGHIHSKQTPQKNIYYCGSSLQQAFGESESNIIPVITWEEKIHKIEEKDLDLPRKKIMYTDVSKLDTFKIPETKDKIKVTVSGSYDEFKAFKKTQKYKEMVKTGTKVIFKAKKEKGEKKEEESTDEIDFGSILSTLITTEKNPFLYEIFELVVNNKEVKADDIVFM